MSGNTVTIPDFVDYPKLYDVENNLGIFDGVFCYFIENYKLSGFSLYLGFREDCFLVRLSDFNSKEIGVDDLDDRSSEVLLLSNKIEDVMKSARISDALFYFSVDNDITLVDVMLSANKFVGPGMLRDLFGNVVETQKIKAIDVINNDTISKHKGSIIKPSRFRYLTEDNIIRPAYGII